MSIDIRAIVKGSSIISALDQAGVRTVVALPDIVTCSGLLWPLSKHSNFRLISVCKEDEGVSICAGLSYCNQRSALLIQHTGFLDSINAIRVIAVEYQLPIVMLVGLQGMEPDGRDPSESAQFGVRIVQPICEAMNLTTHLLNDYASVGTLSAGIGRAYELSQPVVFLIAQHPSAD
ncbi:MAG: thiamine pyrophosphate-binding protein [Acidiferrobacterales bacterium]|nr:thiamine pyrophosphate-binding protein [Acidiferrobacterales bacterium]